MSDPWEQVDARLPVLLVPVRIETQSRIADDGGVELRVRIYPDDIAIDERDGRVRMLPDAFEATALQGGLVSQATGELVTLDRVGVALGHVGSSEDKDAEDAAFVARATALGDLAATQTGEAAWLGDFDEAAKAGLAVTIQLAGGDAPIDCLYVTGVRTADGALGAAEVLEALDAHERRALVSAGTPTNNTEAARAGDRGDDRLAGSAWQPLVRALGLVSARPDAPAPLSDWTGNADPDEFGGVVADVLWPITWDAWLGDALPAQAMSLYDRADLREHLTRFVRPTGPFPAIRVGRQPYGVLPVTLTDALSPADRSEAILTRAVRAGWTLWDSAPAPATVVGADLADVLPRILGLAPASRHVRMRRVLRADAELGATLRRTVPDLERERIEATRALEQRLGQAPGSLRRLPHLGRARLVGLPMTEDSDPEALSLLLDGTAEAGRSVLQLLVTASWSRASGSVRSALADLMRPLDFGVEEITILTEDREHPFAPDLRVQILDRLLSEFTPDPHNPDEDPDAYAVLAALQATLYPEIFDLWAPDVGTAIAVAVGLREQIPTIVESTRRSPFAYSGLMVDRRRELLARLLEYLFALDTWAHVLIGIRRMLDIDSAHRARLFTGALDAASYRFDAWVTSLATRRLDRLRGDAPEGLVVGAYAWLESIQLAPRPAGERREAHGVGWVQAPSTRHAATAAVLRSARLTHAPDDGRDSPLEMDLSSTRTREAVDIVRGMRQGQELGALLGYRFERWLHDESPELNRHLLALRALAPLVVSRETPAETPGKASQAHAGAVVDGVALREKSAADVTAALARRQPWEGWRPPAAGDADSVLRLVARLDEVADAVADLMLVEGVHQLVAGNGARASAAMNALSGDILPEEPEAPAQTREQRGSTWRIGVVGGPGGSVAAGRGWAVSVRASAHPFLERWARGVVGDATRIAVHARPSGTTAYLSSVRISALDLVLAADGTRAGRDRLWARLRRAHRSLPPLPLSDREGLRAGRISFEDAWQLASAARAVLADARALGPQDLVANGSPPEIARHAASASDVRDRRDAVLDAVRTLAAVATPATTVGLLARADALAAIGIGDQTDPATLVSEPLVLGAYVVGLEATLAARIADAESAESDEDALLELTGRVPIVCDLEPPASPGLADAILPPETAPAVRRWMVRLSTVRPALGRVVTLQALRRATGRAGDVAAAVFGAAAWVGDGEPPDSPTTGFVGEAVAGFGASSVVCGFVVDEWTEHRPALRVVDPDTSPPSREQLVSTGLAVHASAPGARAPQALLLAVSPDGAPWSAGGIRAIIDEARRLARMRLATPGDVPHLGELLPAVQLPFWSRRTEPTVDPRALASRDEYRAPFIKGE